VGALGFVPGQVQAQASTARGLPDFTDLVEQVGPAVVNIRTLEKVSARNMPSGMDEEMLEFFKRFGLPIPNMPRGQRPNPRQQQPDDDEPAQHPHRTLVRLLGDRLAGDIGFGHNVHLMHFLQEPIAPEPATLRGPNEKQLRLR